MIDNRKVVVVLPAYNAARTLQRTIDEIPRDIVDTLLLVDDGSSDDTATLARSLGIETFVHNANYGYGRNQKTCYNEALKLGADIAIMLHPDYQYTPKLVTAMAAMIASDQFDVVLGSRILGVGALAGGMPLYKYVFNRFLTAAQNILQWHKLSEYHTGYRAFSRRVLETLPLLENSDDFVFDNEMLAQAMYFGFRIGEISCPAKYFDEASSINLRRSCVYGLGVLWTAARFRLQRWKLTSFRFLSESGRKLPSVAPAEGYYTRLPSTSTIACDGPAGESSRHSHG
jgi:glycosyltransferase involved in cell wall biosynthesis